MELKRKLIQDQQDQIQLMKSSVNETREEKLQLSSNMQKRQQLEDQCVEFTTEIQSLTRDIRVCVCSPAASLSCCCSVVLLLVFVLLQEAKEQLSPLSVALERLQQEKQELLDRKRLRQEEGQEKVRDAHQTPPPRVFPVPAVPAGVRLFTRKCCCHGCFLL